MKVVFAGTPIFAVTTLDAILSHGHEVVLILTKPDQKHGRGLNLVASAVKELGTRKSIPIIQPQTLKSEDTQSYIKRTDADVMIVVAYGLILPTPVLQAFRWGCLNVHASLLPRWRGAAPIQRAILSGDATTGISIMQMGPGLDTGPVLLSECVAIAGTDTAGSLHDRLAALGANLLLKVLDNLERGIQVPLKLQDEAEATYAEKIFRQEAILDFSLSAEELSRKVRAFNPAPGASAKLNGQDLKIWAASVVEDDSREFPGTVVSINRDGLKVACGASTALIMTELQRSGGRRLPASAFVDGFAVVPGDRFLLQQPCSTARA